MEEQQQQQHELSNDTASEVCCGLSGTKRAASESESESTSTCPFLFYCRLSSPSFGKWFSFNPSADENDIKKMKKDEFVFVDPLNSTSSCATLGSLIYIIGGGRAVYDFRSSGIISRPISNTRTADVYCLDTISGEVSKCASMAVAREYPRTAVIHNKIYVMGGNFGECGVYTKEPHWAEVYDPILDKWSFLPPLPKTFASDRRMLTAVLHPEDESEASILFLEHACLEIFIYHVKIQTWLVFDNLPSRLLISGHAVAVNDVIYTWDYGKLYAYHLYNHNLAWTTAVRMGLLGHQYAFLETQPLRLVHVDGHSFCLAWVNNGELHCLLFEASLSINLCGRPYLSASVTSHFVRDVDPLFNHADVVLVDGKAEPQIQIERFLNFLEEHLGKSF